MKNILPKGTYYIGDPCYVFNNESWAELLEKANYFLNEEVVEFKNMLVFSGGTTFGDGHYLSNVGMEFSVDSGTIGAVPIELVDTDSEFWKRAGKVVDFTHSFLVEVKANGTIQIDDIEIYTGYDED